MRRLFTSRQNVFPNCSSPFLNFQSIYHFPFYFDFTDDTYMYDDAARGSMRPHHWYDEPPYESDPDDFLMSGINSGPAAIIQVCLIG